MGFEFKNLDECTRSFMLKEFEKDSDEKALYISDRLNENGKEFFPTLLRDAIMSGDEEILSERLATGDFFNKTYSRKNKNGGLTDVKMPVNAATTLAEGEFSRFYARAICLRAIENGIKEVKVYRAKEVQNPRFESEEKIGKTVSAEKLLDDLRNNIGMNLALGIPAGPNSGLNVELI